LAKKVGDKLYPVDVSQVPTQTGSIACFNADHTQRIAQQVNYPLVSAYAAEHADHSTRMLLVNRDLERDQAVRIELATGTTHATIQVMQCRWPQSRQLPHAKCF
jgi:hypothetical protein